MPASEQPVVFFDLNGTLGRVVLQADGETFIRFDVYSETRVVLDQLKSRVRLGLVSSAAAWHGFDIQGVLRDVQLLDLFEPDLLPLAHPLFTSSRFPSVPAGSLLVSGNRVWRTAAVEAGLRAVPHLRLAVPVLRGEDLFYVQIVGASPSTATSVLTLGNDLPLVPIHVSAGDPPSVFAVATASAAEELQSGGYQIIPLGSSEHVATTDLYLVKDDLDTFQGRAAYYRSVAARVPFAYPTPQGLIVPVTAEYSIDDFHPPAAGHGHTLELRPSVSPDPGRPLPPLSVSELTDEARAALQELTPCLLQRLLDPWCGSTPLNGTRIVSRSIFHEHNPLAAKGVAAELERICGKSQTYEFTHLKMPLLNVEAEISGRELPKELIIIGAHLDSTGVYTDGYAGHAAERPAPGADDDASGIAAVLACAAVLKTMSTQQSPRRSIRFVLFNAEEIGMGGSAAYTDALVNLQAEQRTRVVAMLQMDMVGYFKDPGAFEVHAPGPGDFTSVDPGVLQRSSEIAHLVARMAGEVSKNLGAAQVYALKDCNSDPGADRSDHYRFLLKQMPACLVAEDFFDDVCGKAEHEHAGYHKETDTVENVSSKYAADIARAVAATAWVLANG